MRSDPVFTGGSRRPIRPIHSVICLGFVILLAIVAWMGALWVGQTLLDVAHLG